MNNICRCKVCFIDTIAQVYSNLPMKILTLLLMIIPHTIMAQGLDAQLALYIKDFKLKPIEKMKLEDQNKYKLGKKLFFEKLVSGNKNVSCASCHEPKFFTTDLIPTSVGVGGVHNGKESKLAGAAIIPRNSPHLYNLGEKKMKFMFWDGRVHYDPSMDVYTTPEEGLNGDYPEFYDITDELGSSLATQALFPPLSFEEMRGKNNEIANAKTNRAAWKAIMKRLMAVKDYEELFKLVYRSKTPNIGHFGNAVAYYISHEFNTHDTAWDEYLRGDLNALTTKQKRGALAFKTSMCINCHNGSTFGGTLFRNVVSPQTGPGKDIRNNDEGRFLVTKKDRDKYKFKVPTLRNVALTPPYFHSGAYTTLEQVLNHYKGGIKSIDSYNILNLDFFEKNVYGKNLFVETDRYQIFKKKNNAHPIMKSSLIRMSPRETSDLLDFLKYGLTSKKLIKNVK